jgi:ParB family transcriptional regulator, chromosome partitioning protein
MSKSKGGLGRGLGALIPTEAQRKTETTTVSSTTSGSSTSSAPLESDAPMGVFLAEVLTSSITTNPRQPRQIFDEDSLNELVHSIKELGILQPPVVRVKGSGYELVMGERRLRAATLAGLETIPVIVRETQDDAMLRDALLENLHRSQLNPLEEAAAYDQLLADFGCTHEELAARIGRSRPQISNTIRLLKLPPAVARRVAAGVLSAGHARALLSLPDESAMERLATRIVAEGLSVRAVEEIVALGGDKEKKVRSRISRTTPADIAALAARLGDHLDTRVKIEMGKSRGKIAIEFASTEDLHRIIAQIDARSRDL